MTRSVWKQVRLGSGASQPNSHGKWCIRTFSLTPALLAQSGAGLSVAQQLGAVHAMGVILLVGPRVSETCQRAETIVAEQAHRQMQGGSEWVRQPPQSMPTGRHLVASSSPVGGGMLIRFAAESTQAAYSFLQQVLSPLTAQLGAAPYNERGHS